MISPSLTSNNHAHHESNSTHQPDGPLKLERTGASPQTRFWSQAEELLQAVVSKLRSIGELDLAYGLEACSAVERSFICGGCSRLHSFATRCDKLYCPRCMPRLAAKRRESIEAWSTLIRQPKHVVLTTRNTEDFTRTTVAKFKRAWNSLRRGVVARNWRGGTFALEVTNESKGWHLHSHSLIDADFIDAGILAKEWAKRVGQDFAIVKVKDARDRSYLGEVTKYAVKGSTLASWSPQEIAAYIRAIARTRTFLPFGSLYKMRAEWEATRPPKQKWTCECGETDLRPTVVCDLIPDRQDNSKPRPIPDTQLRMLQPIWPD